MAGDFLRSHGIDIDVEMAQIQDAASDYPANEITSAVAAIHNVSLGDTIAGKRWKVSFSHGVINDVQEHYGRHNAEDEDHRGVDGRGALLTHSLCHPHIHLDKAFLLSHPKFADLKIEHGKFKEAMTLTTTAKSRFEMDDLLERGQRVIDESARAGVTHMRAFVEVDAGVRANCLEAGLLLKQRALIDRKCDVQLCAFAQLPLFSPSDGDPSGTVIRDLMCSYAVNDDVDTIGSTPYVELDRQKMEQNVDWMIDLSIESQTHLDFHLDYNLEPTVEPFIWYVLDALERKEWLHKVPDRTIVFGHCTRLTLFDSQQWHTLAQRIQHSGLPISFVGLPTSDLYMMRTEQQPQLRGTLDVPRLIRDFGLNACLGVNNIGNAFTPQGTCDPLSLASQGVGIYQAGTQHDSERLFEAISTRAKKAIGVPCRSGTSLHIQPGDFADFLVFDGVEDVKNSWKTIRSISDAVFLYDHCIRRRTYFRGQVVQ